jgi:hypothetical protein
MRGQPVDVRFWAKVRKTDSCWMWTGATDKNGYGIFQVATDTTRKAHRFVLELMGKAPAKNVLVCHSCDTPGCVNPAHLWCGDNSANLADAAKKGRCRAQRLTADDVRDIRRKRTEGATFEQLAREYRLSGSGYAHNICSKRKWAHVD